MHVWHVWMPLGLTTMLMPERSGRVKRKLIDDTTAVWYDAAVTQKNPHAVALGRKGGKKGGKARMARLTAAERSELARKAIRIRWDRVKSKRVGQEKT
jgi:hypothetical protein